MIKFSSHLSKYAQDNNFQNIKFFVDDGYSRTTFTRSAFMEMMELAESCNISFPVSFDDMKMAIEKMIKIEKRLNY